MGPHAILTVVKTEKENAILSLKDVTFTGEAGIVGPLSMVISRQDDKVLLMKNNKDRLMLVRIIKGLEAPDTGKIIKQGADATGWVVPDEIVCVVARSRFFSRTVRGELAFAADVAKAKSREKADRLLPLILEHADIGNKMTGMIDQLEEADRVLLSLACTLCMLPAAIILLNPLKGLDAAQAARCTSLLAFGRGEIGCASLQIVSQMAWAIPLNPGNIPEGRIQTGEI